VIRAGTAADAEAVARVQVESWRAAYSHVLPVDGLAALSIEARARMHRRFPPIVAEVDDEIVGFVSVGPARDDDAEGELFAIYVHPEHWGSGVGRELIAAGEEQLRELGHLHAVLWVLEDNPRARRFYEAAGWSVDGAERPIDLLGVSLPEVRYEKRL
jgi:GNAT superfamily N-acetyltransferase